MVSSVLPSTGKWLDSKKRVKTCGESHSIRQKGRCTQDQSHGANNPTQRGKTLVKERKDPVIHLQTRHQQKVKVDTLNQPPILLFPFRPILTVTDKCFSNKLTTCKMCHVISNDVSEVTHCFTLTERQIYRVFFKRFTMSRVDNWLDKWSDWLLLICWLNGSLLPAKCPGIDGSYNRTNS